MSSRDRLVAAWNGKAADHVPLTTWCFGLRAPERLQWRRGGEPVRFWYSKRMEHIHSIPHGWTLEDDIRRARAWQSLGVDDVLDVSVPWSRDAEVRWSDRREKDGTGVVLVREYTTPAGLLRHAVRRTDEKLPDGWVVQPECVELFEDFNVPRGVRHALAEPADVARIRSLYRPPDAAARAWFQDRMTEVAAAAAAEGLAVQAWAAFGMDAAVWLAGSEGTILFANDCPKEFAELLDLIAETDLARAELAASHPGVDLVVQRGWYSATDFWSPANFDEYVIPRLTELAGVVHRCGKKLAYVMTTGVEKLGPRLADAGVDVLYFVDPHQDRLSPERARALLSDRLTLVGGTSALSLAPEHSARLEQEVRDCLEILGPTNRFVLHPVDALFPDTPWDGVERLVELWKRYR